MFLNAKSFNQNINICMFNIFYGILINNLTNGIKKFDNNIKELFI